MPFERAMALIAPWNRQCITYMSLHRVKKKTFPNLRRYFQEVFLGMKVTYGRCINPRRHRPFRILPRHGGGGVGTTLLAVSPLIKLELRGKNERVARRETKRLIYKLKVLGQPVTYEVKVVPKSAEKRRKPVIADNFASDGARAKSQRPACFLRRVKHVTMVFECPWIIFRGQKFEKLFSGHMTSLTSDDPVVPWPHFKSS